MTRSLFSVYFNFKQHQISPSAYLRDWILPLFLDHLPFEACARLWDVIILEGDAFLYRASLAILAVLESRLFFPDRQELLELLRYFLEAGSLIFFTSKALQGRKQSSSRLSSARGSCHEWRQV